MRFEKSPLAFTVKEGMDPVFDEGKYYYYVLEKTGISTPAAAHLIELSSEARVFYSGLKDKDSHSFQWICSETELKDPVDERIKLRFAGKSKKKIFVGMHTHNLFEVTLDDVSENDKAILRGAGKTIFPNYFDDQRFDKNSIVLGRALFSNDFENALKSAMTLESDFDSPDSKKFRKLISKKWGNWKALSEEKILPEKKLKVFSFLSENSLDFKRAVLLLGRRQVGVACRAVQSEKFNELLSVQIGKTTKNQKLIEINNSRFPFVFSKSSVKRKLIVPAVFPQKKSLLRESFFLPENFKAKFAGPKAFLSFELPKGCYATILIKCILSDYAKM